jgi:excinuclease UvrABC ATPase subunit
MVIVGMCHATDTHVIVIVIVIDHHLDLLAADHLIDMGPDGGHILAAGTPEDVALPRAA